MVRSLVFILKEKKSSWYIMSLSWDLAAVVTADSILSPAQSAGSACASEVEAVPSGATVGPNRHWERQGGGGREMENSVMPLQGKNSSRE